jgi:hypothetical protein
VKTFDCFRNAFLFISQRKRRVSKSTEARKIKVNGSDRLNSEGSSSASRFYDNGGDTTSSLSDNFYSDNHNSKHSNGKLNGNGIDLSNQIGFKFQTQAPPPINQRASVNQPNRGKQEPACRGLYDFDAENAEELDFKEGDIIKLIARLDDNWLHGELNGKQGRFPVSYVEIINPLN